MKRNGKNLALEIARDVVSGVLAGMLISLGGAVFLACYPIGEYGKFAGALLFSLALLCICMRGYALYTGKIGLILDSHKKADVSLLLLCLLGNLIGTVAFGFLIGFIFPDSLKATAATLCENKLAQGYGFGLLRAVLCGILVYLSIDIYRKNKSISGILLCIPAFILSGYEHSIANMFYFSAAGIVSANAFGYLMMIVLGNSIGALIIPALLLIRPREKNQNTTDEAGKAPSDTRSADSTNDETEN